MTLSELLGGRRKALARLANSKGAAGESEVLVQNADWLPRPKGPALKLLLDALREAGVVIKGSSFDLLAVPRGTTIDFSDIATLRQSLPHMTFVEVKAASQERVKEDFSGFFFALTEAEIAAAEALGDRHRVVLHNRTTNTQLITSVPEILARAKSMTWQLSVQL